MARNAFDTLTAEGALRDERGAQKCACIGMLRIADDLLRGAQVDDLACVHHCDAVGDVAQEREIVTNEEDALDNFSIQELHEEIDERSL